MPHRPLRVLQIASASDIGGAEQLILNITRHVDRERIEPCVLTLMGDGPLADLVAKAGANADKWSLKHVADPRLFGRMRQFLEAGAYDLVQCYGLRAEVLARRAARKLRIPLISTICSVDPWRRWHHVSLDRWTIKAVTTWISTSESGKIAQMKRLGLHEEQIIVIPTGIPDREPLDETAQRFARSRLLLGPNDGPILGVVANLRPAKGHADLIDAVALLRARWPGLVCLCAGRDDFAGQLQQYSMRKGLKQHFRWLGYQADPAEVYDVAELAVLPSHWEGMPHALIEALRAGRASVATDVGDVSRLVRHEQEGLLCPPRDPSALASALDRALSDRAEREKWGRAARERYVQAFRLEPMIRRFMQVYEQTAHAGR